MTAASPAVFGWPVIRRGAAFFIFWILIAGAAPLGLAIGALASGAAAGLSLRLAPPGAGSLRPFVLLRLGAGFIAESILAGFDVARRAFDPKLPLRPGFVVFHPRLEPGGARDAFYALSSLLPGSLPVAEDENGALLVHCLDASRTVAQELAAAETLFAQAFGLPLDRRAP